jgi:hypothetical protein
MYLAELGYYLVECNTTVPLLSVVIGGVPFSIDPRDLIVRVGPDGAGGEICASGVQAGGQAADVGVFILCVVLFARGVLAGADQVTEALRSCTTWSRRSRRPRMRSQLPSGSSTDVRSNVLCTGLQRAVCLVSSHLQMSAAHYSHTLCLHEWSPSARPSSAFSPQRPGLPRILRSASTAFAQYAQGLTKSPPPRCQRTGFPVRMHLQAC